MFEDVIFLIDIPTIGQLERLLMSIIFQRWPFSRDLLLIVHQISNQVNLLGNHH